ncbi:MAG: hypothetical protein MUF48_17575 [Pirellulaceae bacterium]|jgi:hypothetical protein|nr:hypothetical protein [Pirellulaceae bacterium]
MSFNIYASGTAGFVYSRNHCADGDLFEAAEIINAMRNAGPSPMGVAEGVGDYVLPSAEGQARTGIQAQLGTATRAHAGDGVNLLAMCNQAAQGGWVSVNANRRRALGLWPDATGIRRYNFRPRADAAVEFATLIVPLLRATSMNNWGVWLEVDQALRHYYLHIHGAGRPMILVQLTR